MKKRIELEKIFIALLLFSSQSLAADNIIIENSGNKIEMGTNITIDKNLENIRVNLENTPIENNKHIVNSNIVTEDISNMKISNGIDIYENEAQIINNISGNIEGNFLSKYSAGVHLLGNGISLANWSGIIELPQKDFNLKVINYGKIEGKGIFEGMGSYSIGSGNGISLNKRSNLGYQGILSASIKNFGNISGKIENNMGAQVGPVDGLVTGADARSSGNGIDITGDFEHTLSLLNTGSITGTSTGNSPATIEEEKSITMDGSGNGVVVKKFATDIHRGENNSIEKIENLGKIGGNVNIIGGRDISDVPTNIAQYTFSYSEGSGNGITTDVYSNSNTVSSPKSKIDYIRNQGNITGIAKVAGGKNDKETSEQVIAYTYLENNGNGISSHINSNPNTTINESIIKSIINDGDIYGVIEGKGGTANSSLESQVQSINRNSGNGIGSYSSGGNIANKSIIEKITNNGVISGKAIATSGKILGTGYKVSYGGLYASGNGISSYVNSSTKDGKVDEIWNKGLISGYGEINVDKNIEGENYEKIEFSGNGVAANGKLESLNNLGVIKGSQGAIAASSIDRTKNYGVLAGREIFSDGMELIKNNDTSSQRLEKELASINPTLAEENLGVYIKLFSENKNGKATGKVGLDTEGNVIINSITNGNIGTNTSGKTILNAEIKDINVNEQGSGNTISSKDSNIILQNSNQYENHIINGAGNKTGVLTLADTADLKLKDSIVNSYKTAVTLNNGGTLEASDTSFNGGGLKNENTVVNIVGDNNKIDIKGKSYINGSIQIEGKNNEILLENSITINGNLTLRVDIAER